MSQSEPAGSLGSYLRALREAKGGSLEEMARAIRVGASRLRALESEEFSELPAPVFVKGFIRAYCEFLGERADLALTRYQRILDERAAVAPRSHLPRRSASRTASWGASPILASLVLLVIFGVGLLALNFGFKRAPETVAVEPAVAAVEGGRAAGAPAGSPAATRGAQAPSAAAKGSGSSQRLVVKALETTWMRVQTDDGRVVEELLQPGATREWMSEKRFILTIGNAGGIELELNGRPVPRLGDRGAVIRGLELPRAQPDSGS